MPSASKLLAEKRPLTTEEQSSIITEAEDSLMFNDSLATNAFSILVIAEGFIFFFFGVSDVRTLHFRRSGDALDLALKTGGGGEEQQGLDTLYESIAHFVVCLLAFFAAYRTLGRKSLRRIVVHKLLRRKSGGSRAASRSTSRAGSRRGSMVVTSAPPPPLPPPPTFPAFPPPPPGLVDTAPPPPQFPPPPSSASSFRGASLLESITSPKPQRPKYSIASNEATSGSASSAAEGGEEEYFVEDEDDGPSISLQLNDSNVVLVQQTHRRTAVLSLCLAAPLILLSALLSSTGESVLAPRRLLLCLWQPLQHLVMAWAARALVEDVVVSIEQLKKAQYKYQDA